MVCCLCSEIEHFNVNCPNRQGNVKKSSVILPQIIKIIGRSEDIQGPSSEKIVKVQKILNIDQPRDLDKGNHDMDKEGFNDLNPLEWRLLNEICRESKDSDDEVKHVLHAKQEKSTEETISSLLFADKVSEEDDVKSVDLKEESNIFRTWFSPRRLLHVINRLGQRKINRPGGATQESKKYIRTAIKINNFNEKLRGIIDSDSGRYFLSESACKRVRKFEAQKLKTDLTSRAVVRLGDRSVFNELGGVGFVIDINYVLDRSGSASCWNCLAKL